MTDKELKRRALLGDQETQAQCTEKRIVLPCPHCGGTKTRYFCWITHRIVCTRCGAYVEADCEKIHALRKWNTRPAPPVGRCGECKWYECGKEWYPYCNHPDGLANSVRATDFCCYFEPKED